MPRFDNVSIEQKANVYFDGKCVSHTVVFAAGTQFEVPGDSSFEIETLEQVDYVCHFG